MITDKSTAFVFTHLHRAFAALYEKYHMAEVGIQKAILIKAATGTFISTLILKLRSDQRARLFLYCPYIQFTYQSKFSMTLSDHSYSSSNPSKFLLQQ